MEKRDIDSKAHLLTECDGESIDLHCVDSVKNMSKNVQKHLKLLEFISAVSPKLRKLILKNASNDLVLAICEICLNFCKGNISCKKSCFKKLRQFKASLYKLAVVKKNKKTGYKKERKHLMQHGGAILPLLLAPALAGLVNYFLDKKFGKP